ncbi:Sphingoid long-chain base transporter RSB1 [[Candida] zeylanoides]
MSTARLAARASRSFLEYTPSWAGNIIYLLLFGATFVFTVAMLYKSRYHWYNVTFVCGWGLEFIGFLGRVLLINDPSNLHYFIMQYISLTIAPAFLMGGFYFALAQLVVLYGRQYSRLRPMWYSYIFIAADIFSLLVQCSGGAISSVASQRGDSSATGTHVMVVGLAIQVVSMTVFLYFYLHFLYRTYFGHPSEDALSRPSVAHFARLLCNRASTRHHRATVLEPHYNEQFADLRARPLAPWWPLALLVAVAFVYVRCVYRVVELSEGFTGWLMTREWPLMVLDAMMMAVVALVATPFHPVFVFGRDNRLKVQHIKKRDDEKRLQL